MDGSKTAGLSGGANSIVQLLTVIAIFIIVILLAYFSTRWVGNLQKTKMSGSNIKLLETLRISNTKYLQIVQVGSKYFVIAVCKDTVTYLCEVNGEELEFAKTEALSQSESFKSILDKFKKDKPED